MTASGQESSGRPHRDAEATHPPNVLRLDPAAETERILAAIRNIVFRQLRRKGAVVGVSGGIDSSVVAFLCVRALGADRVQILFTPERDSSAESLHLGWLVANTLGLTPAVEDITSILQEAGCYARRNEALRRVVPEFADGFKFKLALPSLSASRQYSLFSAVVEAPDGSQRTVRLTLDAYLGIVAASNFKQRTRKMMEYYYADLLQYAVAGTPNLLEFDQGFFVKNGDGAADFKPIAHLYKSQVYQLAAYLGVPEEIQRRQPTTDTYPLGQSQEEFFFLLPLEKMDLCLYGKNHQIAPDELALLAGLDKGLVERMYALIEAKRKAARYLHAPPLVVASPYGCAEADEKGKQPWENFTSFNP